MKNSLKISATCFLFILYPLIAPAQKINTEAIVPRIQERVQLMNDYISYMADKDNDYDARLYYRKQALNLFIGKGYSYELDGVYKEGVTMQTTSINRKGTSINLVREYFTNLINLRYTDVEITSTKAENIKVSDLKKIGRNEDGNLVCECSCQYEQYFIAYRDGIVVYTDKTTKRIKCQIEMEETEDGYETVIRLSDIEAICTERN